MPALEGRSGTRMYRRLTSKLLNIFTAWFFFLSGLLLLRTFLPVHNFAQIFPFYQLITINNDLYLPLIQTLCRHLSCSAPLHKTLTVDYYLLINYL